MANFLGLDASNYTTSLLHFWFREYLIEYEKSK